MTLPNRHLEKRKNMSTEADNMENDLITQVQALRAEVSEIKSNFDREFDVSEDEILDFVVQSPFAKFVEEMRKKNPDLSLREIAKEYKKTQKNMRCK